MTIEPARTGVNKKSQETPDITPTNATAPDGGCTVRVSFISTIVVATAVAITHGAIPNDCTRAMDTNAPMKLPPITFRG